MGPWIVRNAPRRRESKPVPYFRLVQKERTMDENRRYAHAVIVAAVAFGLVGCANWSGNKSAEARSDRATTSASAAEPARGPVQTAADATITAKVKTALGNDELVKARNIN